MRKITTSLTTPPERKTPVIRRFPHSFDPFILREYDIRGIYGKSLTETDALALGLAFGTVIRREGGKSVAAGFDGRLSSPGLYKSLVDGIAATGVKVYLVGMGPTPMIYFSGHHLKTDATIMVTGSHNPAEYNGFKMSLKNKPFYGDAIQKMGKMPVVMDVDIAIKNGVTKYVDILPAYIDRLMKDFETGGRELKVAWDCGNGAAGEAVRALTARLPGKHILMYADIDGNFPNHHPDPTVDENLKDLQAKVIARECDLGIAFDGDGDRIGVVDNKGHVIRCDALMALYAADVIKNQPGATIIGDVKCSDQMFAEIERLGGKPLMWKTGHSVIKAKMLETKAPLAGELSGHIFFADKYYGFDDALYCAVRLLNILSRQDEALSDIMARLPQRVGTAEIRIDVDEEKKKTIIEDLKKSLEIYKTEGQGFEVIDIDGIRLQGPNGWLLLRASNTQSCIVARIEANTPARLTSLRKMLENALSASGLSLSA